MADFGCGCSCFGVLGGYVQKNAFGHAPLPDDRIDGNPDLSASSSESATVKVASPPSPLWRISFSGLNLVIILIFESKCLIRHIVISPLILIFSSEPHLLRIPFFVRQFNCCLTGNAFAHIQHIVIGHGIWQEGHPS
jgi:hypothetical protein